ncbi:predicted protein [Naegleria gruberi]|uniref:Predicted protein n=1 Tax=Naegleria gruberi TaxID=5762 RepID=D2VXY6_NAEGR|nr:uncharacterized protein NAEGRDRAFT_74004 [Naegleria gruberi]EFC38320.1 predicted protein [Naegleria gruberi]|eukprot:XP_002671064.1 predicted protein [Naegleria gruberi strain NEG-M]
MEGIKFSVSQLDSLKQFVKYIKYNPRVLDDSEELAFFKDFLINDCGATKFVSTPFVNNVSSPSSSTIINSSSEQEQFKEELQEEEEPEGFLIKEVKTKSLILEIDDQQVTNDKKENKPPVEEKNVMKEMTNVRESTAINNGYVEETSNSPKIPLISEPTATKEKIIEPEKETVLTNSDSKYMSIMNMSDSTSNVKEKDMKVANECTKKGNDLFKKNEYQLAAIYYGKAIECSNGESAMTFIKRAECLAMMNKPLSVRRDCDQAIKLNPDAGKAYNLRGKALLALGKVDLAKKDLEMFKQLNSDISNMDKVDKLIDQINDIRSVEKKEENPTTTTSNTATTKQSTPPQQQQSSTTYSQTTQKSSTTSSSTSSNSSSKPTNSNSSNNGSASTSGHVPNFVNPHVMKLVSGDEYLMRGFQNPRLVNAINEIAMNPSAFLKYNHDIEVVTMFKKFTEIIGKANK